MNHRQGFRLIALASAMALAAACQAPTPTTLPATPPQAGLAQPESSSTKTPARKLMAVADAAELEAAFAATYSAESEFGGAPDAEAILQVANTPEGRAASAIALRGKTGWIYLIPPGSGAQAASYRLAAAPGKKATAPTDPRDPHPPDEARIRAAVENMVPWGSEPTKKKYSLRQVAPGGTVEDGLRRTANNRNFSRGVTPGSATQLPDTPWEYDPDANTVTLPDVNGPGVDISELRGCPTISEGVINDFARLGGLITVMYAGIPNIFGCDLYAGYTPLRWFSGETVPMQPSFYTVCTGAVQTYPFNSGVINTRVQSTFTVPPALAPGEIPEFIDNMDPAEKKGAFLRPGTTIGHTQPGSFSPSSTRPGNAPIVWEREGGASPIVAADQPDSGQRGAGAPTPDPSQPPSPGASTSPTPGSPPPQARGVLLLLAPVHRRRSRQPRSTSAFRMTRRHSRPMPTAPKTNCHSPSRRVPSSANGHCPSTAPAR